MSVIDNLTTVVSLEVTPFVAGAKRASDALDSIDDAIHTLVPGLAALGAAFTAKKALDAFATHTQSSAAGFKVEYAGAKAYRDSLESAKDSVDNLAAAVGEFLAPAATAAAKAVSAIADTLVPVVRSVSAFKDSSIAFITQLGRNFITAFSQLMPTATAALNYVRNFFSGAVGNMQARLDQFRQAWNAAWEAILRFSAPIMVAAARAIDAALSVAGDAASRLVLHFSGGLGNASGVLTDIANAVQNGLVTAFAAAETVIRNLGPSFELVKTGALVAIQFIQDNWKNGLTWMTDALGVLKDNAITIFNALATGLRPTWEAIGDNITEILTAAFGASLENMSNKFEQWRAGKGQSIVDFLLSSGGAFPVSGSLGLTPQELEAQFPTNKRARFPNLSAIPAPDLSGLGALNLKSLPTFGANTSAAQSSLLDSLGKMFTSFSNRVGERAGKAFGGVGDFIKAIGAGLPGLSATPSAMVAVGASDKLVGAFQFGSKEAYSAIIKATGGGTDVQQRQLEALQAIRDNTKSKPKKASVK